MVVLNIIHVLEYLWLVDHSLYDVVEKRQSCFSAQIKGLMQSKHSRVVVQMKRRATIAQLEQRKGVDGCARYLMNHKHYLCYKRFLLKGCPLATGVIIARRTDRKARRLPLFGERLRKKTGARWGLLETEAVFKLIELVYHVELDEYGAFQLHQARIRNNGQHRGNEFLYARKEGA